MLKHIICLLIFFNVAIISMAQSTGPRALEQYKWEQRLFIVFADTDSSNLYKKQIKELRDHEDGLQDRDLKILHLFIDDQSHSGVTPLPEETVGTLYQTYDIAKGDFVVILIGKDGTEKLRARSPLPTDKLFSVIDAMPMRQREMQQRQ